MTDLYEAIEQVDENKDFYDLLIWTDGACEDKNPGGTCSIGVVIKDCGGEVLYRHAAVIGSGYLYSNNCSKYAAVSWALERAVQLMQDGDSALIRTDSMLVVKQMCGRWKVKGGLYKPFYDEAMWKLQVCRNYGLEIDIQWVPREKNTEADALTKYALAEVGITPTVYKKKKVKR